MARMKQVAGEGEDALFELDFDGQWFTVGGSGTSRLRLRQHKANPTTDLVSENDLLVATNLTRDDWATLFRVSGEMLQRLRKV